MASPPLRDVKPNQLKIPILGPKNIKLGWVEWKIGSDQWICPESWKTGERGKEWGRWENFITVLF
jgi:hypothetical protein